ncbi:MAG: sigma-70 family RNA polymerase sigma factor [Clostridia bacterium]|nr:sigma-70 family RNA polymerase sigma factor [Clostridia bacterium]
MKIEELIDLYGDDMLRLCLSYLGDRQLAEDAFQETFLKAWKAMDAFRGESSPKTWLASIAVNTCRDMLRTGWLRMLRKSQPIETLLDLPSDENVRETSPVRAAVLGLPGMYREVILLYYDQNMTLKDIAALLHLSVNTVSTRLRRARKQLEKELKGEIEL